MFHSAPPDQCKSSYQVGFDNSLRISYANGMDTHYQTEPHILAGAANPTVARRNMSLPGDTGQNLVEWRFRKEQSRGKVIVFGRKLRVGRPWPPGRRVRTTLRPLPPFCQLPCTNTWFCRACFRNNPVWHPDSCTSFLTMDCSRQPQIASDRFGKIK